MNQASKFNRLFTILTLSIIFFIGVPILFAEEPHNRRPHSPKMGKPHFEYGNKIPSEMIIKKLEPTEEQIEKIHALADETRATTRSQRKQMREIKKRLKTELALDEPAAVEVGQLVISRNNLSQEIRKTHRSFRESLAKILTRKQRKQLKKLRTYLRHQRTDGKNHRPEWGPPISAYLQRQ